MVSDILKYICVRIDIVIDGEVKQFGSGTLFKYDGKTYIVTAEHCIYGTEKSRYENITKDNILVKHKFNNNFTEITVNDIVFAEDKPSDTALLEVEYNGKIPNIEFATEIYANNLYLRGYPKWLEGKEAATHQVVLKDEQTSSFIISSNDFIDASGRKDTEEFTKNLSGSGVFIKEKHRLILVGIVSELRTEKGTLGQVKCSKLNLIFEKFNIELNNNQLLAALNRQSKRQLNQQINSKKYIPNLYIEEPTFKDLLRFFSVPFLFLQKNTNDLSNIDLRHFNRKQIYSKGQTINIDNNRFGKDTLNMSFKDFAQNNNEIKEYLNSLLAEFEQINNNNSYYAKRKIEDKIPNFDYLTKRIYLIQDSAGQGKTNLICDLVDKTISKRNIPCIYLSGYDINADAIEKSILDQIPAYNESNFYKILSELEIYCNSEQVPLIIIIDGLNENIDTKKFSRNVETFISNVLEYSCVKIILTCRKEYFEYSFSNLLNSAFKDELLIEKEIKGRFNKKLNEILFNTYLKRFNIKLSYYSDKVYKQLTGNFFLLRIFSESNKNKTFDTIENIYKENILAKYLDEKVEAIRKKLKTNDEFCISSNQLIIGFIDNIVTYMISNNQFLNIPLNKIIVNEGNREILIRFIDENIIVKNLSKTGQSILDRQEVINFTFDEFRDYLIYTHLFNRLINENPEFVKKFMVDNFNEKSTVFEGISTFLIYNLRNETSNELILEIKKAQWYPVAFSRCIFQNIPDEEINQEDIEYITKLFKEHKKIRLKIIEELVYRRYNPNEYERLNIQLLIQILSKAETEMLNCYLEEAYGADIGGNKIGLDTFTNQLRDILNDKKKDVFEQYSYLFEFLFYFIPLVKSKSKRIDENVNGLYFTYYLRHKNHEQLKRLSEAYCPDVKKRAFDYLKMMEK